MADYIAILQAIVISAVTAGFYAFLGWARSRNPETGEFEEFKSSKFVATLLLAVVLGGIAGALGLEDIGLVEGTLGPMVYPILAILVQLAAQAISRRVGWT